MKTPKAAVWRLNRGSLRWKIAIRMGGTTALAVVVIVVAFNLRLRALVEGELRGRGDAVVSAVAASLAAASFDRAALQALALAMQSGDEDVGYVIVRSGQGEVRALAVAPALAGVHAEKLPACDVGSARSSRVAYEGIRLLDSSAPIGSTGCLQVGLMVAHSELLTSRLTWMAAFICLVVLLGSSTLGYLLSRSITGPLERLALAAGAIARGELAQQVDVSGEGEVRELAAAFQKMAEGLQRMLADVRSAAVEIDREASDILTTTTRQAALAGQQAAATTETSATASQIAATSRTATEYADSVIALSARADQASQEGQQVVDESRKGMQALTDQMQAIARSITDLAEHAAEIGGIVTVVKDLAEQSNLLALNASVEAARAAGQGASFMVVAGEMRKLASQSKRATADIRTVLGEIQKKTRAAVAATEEGSRRAAVANGVALRTGGLIAGLGDALRESSGAARQIATNTRQQALGVDQIAGAMGELSSAATDALNGTQRLEEAAYNLSQLSKRLNGIVAKF